MSQRPRFRERLRAALVVTGITLGILVLFFLQFALPYWLGPLGLAVAVFVDAAIYGELRHRHNKRRRARMGIRDLGGPADLHAAFHDRRPPKDEYVVTVAFLVFVVGISMEGVALQANSWSATYIILNEVGSALMLIASLIWWPYSWRFYDWRSESEKYDTTEDH
ncbi:MAG TPA: hypothetical protein VEY12_12885 [Thermoplasmata archaeon]|nr:hypothetical protein [Thermoplasmata archaeon]